MPIMHDDEPNEAPITEMYVFLSVDVAGNEGILGMSTEGGGWFPFVTSKQRIVDQIKPIAFEIARLSGKAVKLVKFTQRVDVPLKM